MMARHRVLIILILVLQFALVAATFPLSELLTETPILYIDAPYHWYQMKLAANIADSGSVVGYDPFFNAGYPGGVTYNWSAKALAALDALLSPWISAAVLYKISSFSAAVLGPACVPIAAHWLRVGPRIAALASGFGLILWWASYFRWYHTAGMVAFVMASYLTLPYCALALRYLREDAGTSLLVILGVSGALATFYHPLFPLPVAVIILTFLVFFRDELSRRRILILLTLVPLLSVLPNLAWIYPMVHFHHVFSAGVEQLIPNQRFVDVSLIWKEMIGVFHGHYHGAKIYLLLALTSTWACVRIADPTQRRLAWTFALSATILILYAALGAAVPGVDRLQPNRFLPVGYLLLTIPAAMGIVNIATSVRGNLGSWSARAAFATLIISVALGGYCLFEVKREVSTADVGHYGKHPPEVNGVGDYSRWVFDWLQRNTTRAGRVLFETSGGRVHDGGVMAGYYAYMSEREFIGGPYPFMHFAGFWDGWIFEKPIQNIDPDQFAQYLELYNIGWIIGHSDATKTYLESLPWIKAVGEYKQLRTYTVDRPLSFFISGNGRVARSAHNNLTIADVETDEVVLKYHFVPGMKSTPAATLEPVWMMDDPNPFIKIVRPPRAVTLHLPGWFDGGSALPP